MKILKLLKNSKSVVCLTLFVVLNNININAQTLNFDESKVLDYTLPNPLLTNDNNVVSTTLSWDKTRRGEILTMFENTVYGTTPTKIDSIKYTVVNNNPLAMDGKAHLKEVQIKVYNNNKFVTITLTLFIPNNSKPAPVFVMINHRAKSNTDPTRAIKSDFWPAEMLIDEGFAISAFQVSDVSPDDKYNYSTGVLSQLYPDQLSKNNGMKAIGAWSWAASRAMDYFMTDPDIDNEKVVVIGHSRSGKAALWAGAQDKRFAITISNNSGCGGAKLSKRNFGEDLYKINNTFPHWFCENFKNYISNEAALPLDQHMLLSLIAPRHLYVASSVEDLNADPKGELLGLKNAEPVFQLFNADTLPIVSLPQENVPFIKYHNGYHIRSGNHGLILYDWTQYVAFAKYHFRSKPNAALTYSQGEFNATLSDENGYVTKVELYRNNLLIRIDTVINNVWSYNYSDSLTGYAEYYIRIRDNDNNTSTSNIINNGVSNISQINNNSKRLIIYPNPSNGLVNLEYPKTLATIDFKVFDMSGKQMYCDRFNHKTQLKFDQKGLYIIKSNIEDVICNQLIYIQ